MDCITVFSGYDIVLRLCNRWRVLPISPYYYNCMRIDDCVKINNSKRPRSEGKRRSSSDPGHWGPAGVCSTAAAIWQLGKSWTEWNQGQEKRDRQNSGPCSQRWAAGLTGSEHAPQDFVRCSNLSFSKLNWVGGLFPYLGVKSDLTSTNGDWRDTEG